MRYVFLFIVLIASGCQQNGQNNKYKVNQMAFAIEIVNPRFIVEYNKFAKESNIYFKSEMKITNNTGRPLYYYSPECAVVIELSDGSIITKERPFGFTNWDADIKKDKWANGQQMELEVKSSSIDIESFDYTVNNVIMLIYLYARDVMDYEFNYLVFSGDATKLWNQRREKYIKDTSK